MLPLSYLSTALFMLNPGWTGTPPGKAVGIVLFLWIFAVILGSSFSVVRHADHLAEILKEPLGTLILTLGVTGMEVMMISALMLHGDNPALARDTMFSVVMIVLGGLLGTALLTGGLRFKEQAVNLKGVHSFLGLILPLSVFSLILPNFTAKGGIGMFTSLTSIGIVLLSLGIYAVFLAVQTRRHRDFFNEAGIKPGGDGEGREEHPPAGREFLLMLLHMLPVVILSKKMALLLDFGLRGGNLPLQLGGLLVATLILAPEGLAAIRAASRNKLQRSINVLLGSVLATISLTVPAALAIGLAVGKPVLLGLPPAEMTLLAVTLASCIVTFGDGHTNILEGFVHLMLFATYIVLVFD
jgi:Ca2+:H+ antiporter